MNKSLIYLLVAVLFSFSACQKEESGVEQPANLLPKEQLIPLTAELHLLESAISMTGAPDTASARYFHHKSQEIYKKFATDSVTYRLSYEFYEKNNNEMNIIYQAVNDTLTSMRKKIEEQIIAPKNDSIKK